MRQVDEWSKSSYCGASNTCVETRRFRKSTYSSNEGNCTEVAKTNNGVEIQDSKFPGMPHIFLSKENFATLLNHIKNS